MSKRSLASAFSSPSKSAKSDTSATDGQRRNFQHIGKALGQGEIAPLLDPPPSSNSYASELSSALSPGRRLVGSRPSSQTLAGGVGACTDLLVAEKMINDPIHTAIKLDRLSCRIIDTPQYQRLRHLKQLGTSEYVFPSARHTRFEHSLGVAHLAERVCRKLQEHQPELGITDVDILCVKIAGLCHDLGHGPFSHVYDGVFIKLMFPRGLDERGQKWRHEDGSVSMFRYILSANHIRLAQFGLGPTDQIFIEEIIGGESETTRRGRAPDKFYLYDVVNNTRSGLDVDKLDYFQRDMHYANVKFAANFERFIELGRVIRATPISAASGTHFQRQLNGGWLTQTSASQSQSQSQSLPRGAQGDRGGVAFPSLNPASLAAVSAAAASGRGGSAAAGSAAAGASAGAGVHLPSAPTTEAQDGYQLMVCYPQKLVFEAIDMFSVRFRMHKTVYTHKAAKQVEFMITDILKEANEFIRIKGACSDRFPDGLYKISECVFDMEALSNLNDSVVELIRYDQNPGLEKAKAILRRLECRQLYVCLGKSAYTREDINAGIIKSESDILDQLLAISKDMAGGHYDGTRVMAGGPDECDSRHNQEHKDAAALGVIDMAARGAGAEDAEAAEADRLDLLEPCGNSQDSFYSVNHHHHAATQSSSQGGNRGSSFSSLQQQQQHHQWLELTREDVIIEKMHIHYGLKDKNPVSRLRFFPKHADSDAVGTEIKDRVYKTSMPTVFEEFAVRVFCRTPSKEATARRAFQIWCKGKLSVTPFQCHSPGGGESTGMGVGAEASDVEDDEGDFLVSQF